MKAFQLLHLPIWAALAFLAACSQTSPLPERAGPIKPEAVRKDYSHFRIRGRESLSAADTTVYADKKMVGANGDISFSGRVFVEFSRSGEDLMFFGRPMYAYTETARWSAASETLILEGFTAMECTRAVMESTDAACLISIQKGKVTTKGTTRFVFDRGREKSDP